MSRRIVRFSLDLEAEQRNFVRLFALKNGINASVVMRAMLYRLETDPIFANQVIDLIFSVPEEEVDEEDFEEGIVSADEPQEESLNTISLAEMQPGDHVYDAQGNKVIIQ